MKKNNLFVITSIILPLVLAVAGIFITKALTEKKKSITLEIQINKKLFSLEERIKDQIDSLEIEELFDDLNFMSIRLVNNGKIGINGKIDIVKDLEIIFPDDYKILGTPSIIENLNDVEIIFSDSIDDNKIIFGFDLLNPKQSVTMDFFYKGKNPTKPTFKPKIVDLNESKIIDVSPSREEQNMQVFNLFSSGLLFLFMMGIAIIVTLSIYNLSVFQRSGKARNQLKIAISLFAGVAFVSTIQTYFRIMKLLDISKSIDSIFPVVGIVFFSIYGVFITFLIEKKKKARIAAMKKQTEDLERIGG